MRIVDRVAAALAEAADELLLVANDPAADAWLPSVRRVGDLRPGLGSLGGIHTALATTGGATLVVAWDMPFVSAALLRALREAGRGHDAAVPASGSKRGVEPLCAYYGPACLPAIEHRLEQGDRRVIAFHEDVDLVRLPASEVARHGDPDTLFMNVNTPDDLERAERIAAAAAGGRRREKA